MKYLGLVFKWIGIIIRIIPVIEKLYPQIIASIEVIKEEINNANAPGETKRANVRNKLGNKLEIGPRGIGGVIDSTVSVLKGLNVL